MCCDITCVALLLLPFPRLVLLVQAEALRQSMTSISWIAVLLATASFIGFVTVPGGYLDLGLAQLALKKTKVGRVGSAPGPPTARSALWAGVRCA